jgi:hypothetical protein
MDNRCTLYISSCDKYSDLWEPFFKLFMKYWPDCPYPIVLVSETKTFSYPGLDIQCPRFYEPDEPSPWGERNIRTLESIDSQFIFFMLDDFFIFQPVNQPFMDRSLDWMQNDPMIGKFQWRVGARIRAPNKYAPYGVEYLTGTVRVCAFPAIWRRDLLIRSILPHENPWQWEREGTERSKLWPENLYSSYSYPIKYPWGGALWKGKWNPRGVNVLKMNDISVSIYPRGYANTGNGKLPLDQEIDALMAQWNRSRQTVPAAQRPERIRREISRTLARAANPVPRRRNTAAVRPKPPRPARQRMRRQPPSTAVRPRPPRPARRRFAKPRRIR